MQNSCREGTAFFYRDEILCRILTSFSRRHRFTTLFVFLSAAAADVDDAAPHKNSYIDEFHSLTFIFFALCTYSACFRFFRAFPQCALSIPFKAMRSRVHQDSSSGASSSFSAESEENEKILCEH